MEKKLNGTPITYWMNEKKDAQTIVFIHAAFADHTMFDEQMMFFSTSFQVISLDLIGHGKSTHATKDDSINKTSKYLLSLCEEESLDKIHLVGVSIGALLIQDFANHYPEKVASLVCIGGYDINNFDSKLQNKNRGMQMKLMLKALVSIRWFAHANKYISAYTPEAQAKYYEMNIKFKRNGFKYLTQLSKIINQSSTLTRSYPMLIGCGEFDNEIALEAAKQWHNNEPQAKLVIFKHSGHLVPLDYPELFNTVLMNFLVS